MRVLMLLMLMQHSCSSFLGNSTDTFLFPLQQHPSHRPSWKGILLVSRPSRPHSSSSGLLHLFNAVDNIIAIFNHRRISTSPRPAFSSLTVCLTPDIHTPLLTQRPTRVFSPLLNQLTLAPVFAWLPSPLRPLLPRLAPSQPTILRHPSPSIRAAFQTVNPSPLHSILLCYPSSLFVPLLPPPSTEDGYHLHTSIYQGVNRRHGEHHQQQQQQHRHYPSPTASIPSALSGTSSIEQHHHLQQQKLPIIGSASSSFSGCHCLSDSRDTARARNTRKPVQHQGSVPSLGSFFS